MSARKGTYHIPDVNPNGHLRRNLNQLKPLLFDHNKGRFGRFMAPPIQEKKQEFTDIALVKPSPSKKSSKKTASASASKNRQFLIVYSNILINSFTLPVGVYEIQTDKTMKYIKHMNTVIDVKLLPVQEECPGPHTDRYCCIVKGKEGLEMVMNKFLGLYGLKFKHAPQYNLRYGNELAQKLDKCRPTIKSLQAKITQLRKLVKQYEEEIDKLTKIENDCESDIPRLNQYQDTIIGQQILTALTLHF